MDIEVLKSRFVSQVDAGVDSQEIDRAIDKLKLSKEQHQIVIEAVQSREIQLAKLKDQKEKAIMLIAIGLFMFLIGFAFNFFSFVVAYKTTYIKLGLCVFGLFTMYKGYRQLKSVGELKMSKNILKKGKFNKFK